MLLRVRSNVGIWRVDGLNGTDVTTEDVLERINETRPNVSYEKPLSKDPACKSPLDTSIALSKQGIQHGSMMYCQVDASSCVENTVSSEDGIKQRKVIDKDGTIRMLEPSYDTNSNGFRKG